MRHMRPFWIVRPVAASWLLALVALVGSGQAKGPTYDDPAKTDADFAFQGEYVGELERDDGDLRVGVQVVALGGGKFDAVGYHGGLPGDGWDRGEKFKGTGELQGDTVTITGEHGKATIKDGVLTVISSSGETVGELEKVERKSPTLGAKPPKGALVLFDGKSADAFEGGRMTDDGLLMQGTNSKQKFGDCTLHLEFRLPYQPEDRGQARGNSGVYLQGRYEVQMLDSFGLEGKDNECGGLYGVRAPTVNMCFPPLSWQTYDIDYTAAKYEGEKIVAGPRITVRHNGVLIHDNVELPKSTTAAIVPEGPDDGPLHLQDHGNPVRYRNIWIVEK